MAKIFQTGAAALTCEQQQLITPDLMDYATALAVPYHHCSGSAMQPSDLDCEAIRGLCEAALRFNPVQGAASFKTFATFYIQKHVLLAIEKHGCPMRLPREAREELRIISIDARLQERLRPGCDDPDDEHLSAADESISSALGEEMSDAEQERILLQRLEQLMQQLTKQEQRVVRLVHGLDAPAISMKEAAKRMNITHDRARQIYNRAIAKLQLAAN